MADFDQRVARRLPRPLAAIGAWRARVWVTLVRHRDAVVAVGLLALAPLSVEQATGSRPLDLLGLLLLAAATLPVGWWRRAPIAVLASVAGALALYRAAGYPATAAWLALGIAAYAVASLRGPRVAFAAVAAGAAAAMGAPLLAGTPVTGEEFFGGLVLFALPTLLGDRVYARRVAARSAARDERERIARELHDSVAHALSVMVIQVEAAEAMLDRDPQRARDALDAVRRTGRESLGEMRQMLGELRAETDREPLPGVAQLPGLVDATRQAGIEARLVTEGDPAVLSSLVDLSVYRIVQEALTNVRRHARATRAEVSLRFAPGQVTVRVSDDGRGASANLSAGHGLAGMGERARLCGGELHAGPREGGGFEVVARLPVVEVGR